MRNIMVIFLLLHHQLEHILYTLPDIQVVKIIMIMVQYIVEPRLIILQERK